MPDIVVTVPKDKWGEWIAEGDLAGDSWSGTAYAFSIGPRNIPHIGAGERVYVVAHGRLRGYALFRSIRPEANGWGIVRGGEAVAVTIPDPIRGFQGWRYRWWNRDDEVPFPDWKEAGVRKLRCRFCSFEVAVVRRLKSGKVRMGRDTLTWHVREKHPAEYAKIRSFVGRSSTSTRRPTADDE